MCSEMGVSAYCLPMGSLNNLNENDKTTLSWAKLAGSWKASILITVPM